MSGNDAEWVSALAGAGTLVATVGTLFVAVGVWAGSYQGRLRSEARAALIEFTTSDVARARDRVSTLRRTRLLNRRERVELRRDAFALLWALERLGGVRDVANSAIAPDDLNLLYRHVDAVTGELHDVVLRHTTLGCFRETVERANAALDALPNVRNSWGWRRKNTRPLLRLPAITCNCPAPGSRR